MDLVTDPVTGRLRETLVWSNLGKCAALIAFGWEVYRERDSDWLWFIVMGVLTAHEAVSRWMSAKAAPIVTPGKKS